MYDRGDDAILLLFSIIIEVMNTKAYNGVRYLSKNGHYYTENYGSSSYSVIEIEDTFLTNKFLAIKKIVSR